MGQLRAINELRKKGAFTSAAGRLQQIIFYAFGNYDNELRKEKTIRGMIENLLNGYWVGVSPLGYTNLKRKEKAKYHEYVINEQGKILKLAYKWKTEGRMSNREIVDKMRKMGSTINYKSFVRILSNPFYCGYITHSLIPGQIIKGHHPPLVSVELFQKANNIILNNPHKGIAKKAKVEELPLKGFARDEVSQSPFTGYAQKGQWYYKTRGIGTRMNQNAKMVHAAFLKELAAIEPKIKDDKRLEDAVLKLVKEKLGDLLVEQEGINNNIGSLKSKINSLEERFIEGELDKELYLKYKQKYEEEIGVLEKKISRNPISSSNLEMAVKKAVSISRNLSQLWLSSDYSGKYRLQYLVYPDGIMYNKQNNTVRTPRINSLFGAIAYQSRVLDKKRKGQSTKIDPNSCWVARTRIELVSRV